MPSRQIVDAFIQDVLSNDHVAAAERWYSAAVTMRENVGEPSSGREQLIERERAIAARASRIESEIVSGPLIDGDTVAIRWRFSFTWKDGGAMQMEEVAWQEWRDGQIVREIFFYDPAQRDRPIACLARAHEH